MESIKTPISFMVASTFLLACSSTFNESTFWRSCAFSFESQLKSIVMMHRLKIPVLIVFIFVNFPDWDQISSHKNIGMSGLLNRYYPFLPVKTGGKCVPKVWKFCDRLFTCFSPQRRGDAKEALGQ